MHLRFLSLVWLCCGQVMAADPIPLRREVVTPERLAAELARNDRGAFIRLSRAEFEARVQKAAAGIEQRHDRPQLLRAEYTARFDDGQFIGTARWTIRNNTVTVGRLNIEPFSAALRSVKWIDGTEVVMGPLDDNSQQWELLVAGIGVKTLELEWSSRGQPRPDGVHFDLRWPAASIVTHNWNLPPSVIPIVGRDAGELVQTETDKDGRRIWTFATGGASQIGLVLAPVSESSPYWLAKQKLVCRLQPHRVESEFQLELATGPHRSDKLELIVDPNVLVRDILAPGIRKWSAIGENRFQLQFAEPINATNITLQAVNIPATGASTWNCPNISIVGGVPAGETIELVVPPDVGLDDFRTGAFKLVDSRVATDGGQTIRLESRWAKRAETGRPNGRLRLASGTVDVAEQRLWEIGADRQALSCRLQVRPVHEPLSIWSISLPAQWDVDNVECMNNEALRWSVRRGANDRPMLHMEFDRPQPIGVSIPLTIEYRRVSAAPLASWQSFPDPQPGKVRSRTVRLQVRHSPLFEIEARTNQLAIIETDVAGPKPEANDDFTYEFPTGHVDGELLIRARHTRFTASGAGRLRVRHDDLLSEYRVSIRPESGALSAVTMTTVAPANGAGIWTCTGGATIRRVVRLDPLGLWAACSSARFGGIDLLPALAALGQGGATWHIVFDRPTNQPVTLDYTEVLRREPEPESVVSRALLGLSGESILFSALSKLTPATTSPLVAPAMWSVVGAASQVHTWGYFDLSNRTQPPAEWRAIDGVPTLRYRNAGPPVLIDLSRRALRRLSVSEARITASLTGDDRIMVRYQAAIRAASGSRVPLELPEGARLMDARGAGHNISAMQLVGRRLEFDFPAEAAVLPVEIVYTMPGLGGWPLGRLNAAAPRWAGDAGATLWSWHLPDGWEPCDRSSTTSSNKLPPKSSAPLDLGTVVVPSEGPMLWVIHQPAFQQACWLVTAIALAVILIWQPGWTVTSAALLLSVAAWLFLAHPIKGLVIGPTLILAMTVVWQRWPRRFWRVQMATTMLALVLMVTMVGAGPLTRTVFIVPASDQQTEMVYAPGDLLSQLDQLAAGQAPTASCVLQSADYRTQVDPSQVHTDAEWVVDVLQPGGEFIAPIRGSDLIELRVDQQPAIPNIRAEQLHVPLAKKGRVVVTARLLAKAKELDGVHSLNCAIPQCLRSHWTVTCPTGYRVMPDFGSMGAIAASEHRWAMDLGRVSTLKCAWQTSQSAPASVIIQEAYLWDLHRPTARLFGILKCPMPQTEANEWRIDIPPDLAVADARMIDGPPLIGWRREHRSELETLILQVAGATKPLTALLEFVPRQPLNPAVPLPMPSCQRSAETLWSWRGLEARPGPMRGLITVPEDPFRRDWLTPCQLNNVDMPVRVWRKSVTANDPFVRVNVGPSPQWKGEPTLRWQLGSKRADLSAAMALHCDNGVLPMVEFDIPPAVTVAQVNGSHVARWSRVGPRLQIWLDQPRNSATIEVLGWCLRSDEGANFDVPAIRLINAAPGVRIILTTRPGWELTSKSAHQLTQQPNSSNHQLTFVGDRPTYQLSVQPTPTYPFADYRLMTAIDLRDGRPVTHTTIEARTTASNVGRTLIKMASAPGDEVTMQAPELRVTEQPTLGNRRVWLVEPLKTPTSKWEIQIQVISHAAAKAWTVPRTLIEFDDLTSGHSDHVITVGSGLRVLDSEGLQAITTSQWQTRRDPWRLDVEPTPTRPPRR